MTMDPHIPQIQQLIKILSHVLHLSFFCYSRGSITLKQILDLVIFPMFTSVNIALKNTLFTDPQCRYLVTTMPLS